MVSVTVSLVAFLALMAWRFVFAGLQRRPLLREMAAPQQGENNLLDRVGVAVAVGVRIINRAPGGGPIHRTNITKTVTRSIVVLIQRTQTGDNYVVGVGNDKIPV